MKSFSIALATLLTFVLAGLALGQAKNTGYIVGSSHDFGANGYSWASGEICKPCHTPHNAIEADVSDNLWSHTLSTASYTLPGGDVLPQEDALDAYSRLCMSCHDGTVALDAFIGGLGTSGPFGANSPFNMGTDLSNDHPVGKEAVYDDTRASLNLTTTNSRGQVVVGVSNPAQGKAQLPLRPKGDGSTDVVVSCGSCHNPHGAGNGTARYPDLLRMSNQESQMCLTCHIK